MNRLTRTGWLGAVLAVLLLAAPAVAENQNHNLTVSVDPSGHVETGWRFELPTGLTVHGEVGFLNGGECSTDGTEIDCDDLPDNTVQNIATASAAVGYTRTVGTVDITFAGNVTYAKAVENSANHFSPGVELEAARGNFVAFLAWNHALSDFVTIDQFVLGDGVRVGVGYRF